ncbi:right-handed parallel beta-helix repeat-containing protein [Reyranella sp.]|uniref:right-handed parallel beta-helix repeat-containing protein n=1 Tax=Reyranella sp. TaxID=1929291 RepID=UPI001202D5F9|nr:right-handed parallel beta-helix repeat-containing protein [Reyranella sp.]TAJ82887.1 MAG: hypothetical protein EPO50_24615 [Reyranella sp.]
MTIPYMFAERSGRVPGAYLDADFAYVNDVSNATGILPKTRGGTGGDTSQEAAENLSVGFVAADLAELKALTSRPPEVLVKTGRAAGMWEWVSGSSATPDDALVVQCSSGESGRYKRVYDGRAFAEWFGVVGDGVTDDTGAFERAVASGVALDLGSLTILVTNTISLATYQNWCGAGAALKFDSTVLGYILPLLNVDVGAAGSQFEGIEFDHNASGVDQASLSNQVAMWWQCCVVNQANHVTFANCTVRNAWDSGFANGRVAVTGDGSVGSPLSLSAVPGFPEAAIFDNCRAFDCGLGDHHTYGPEGFYGNGFGNGGSRTEYANCYAKRCYGGIAGEFGAVTSGTVTNCVVDESLSGGPQSLGLGFWFGDGPYTVTGCIAMFCAGAGFTVADTSDGAALSNCYAYANGREGFVVGKSNTTLTGCIARNNSQETTNTYSAFVFDSNGAAIANAILVGCAAVGTGHKYGLEARGSNTIDADVTGCSFVGATAATNLGSYSVAVLSRKSGTRNFGVNSPEPLSKLEAADTPVSYLTIAVGNAGNFGALAAVLAGTPGKRVALAYDGVNDVGVIQSIHSNTLVKPTFLNPSGGDVMAGKGSWNTGCMRLGDYRLWIDSSGRLRIKSSAPSSDTDGTVVGTQT